MRALIAQARLFENVFKLKTRQVYFIYPFPRRMKLGKALKICRVHFFRLSWHFKGENSVFWKESLLQNRTDSRTSFVYNTSRLVRISVLISALNKVFFSFSRESFFYKSSRNFSSRVYIAWYKHSRVWENSRQLCKPVSGLHNCLEFSQPLSCFLCKHGKRSLLLKYFSCGKSSII